MNGETGLEKTGKKGSKMLMPVPTIRLGKPVRKLQLPVLYQPYQVRTRPVSMWTKSDLA